MKACVFTLGCKQNEVESASLMQGLIERGWEVTDELSSADLYLLNTCAVTAEAERKSRQAIARMRKHSEIAPIAVFGCVAQNNPTAFAEKEGVAFVSGAMRKDKVLEYIDRMQGSMPEETCKAGSGEIITQSESVFCELPVPARTKTRAYLRIQDGCNRFCSYCLIPYLRGRSRSRSFESVLAEAKACGAKEIVITGIDLSSYRDEGRGLGDLLTALADMPARIRLGSLEVSVITEDFLAKMKAAKNVMPHFHLSLQSGSNRVLRAMNRRYTREEYLAACNRIYQYFPEAAITTDIIVGFPEESEADFEESLSILEEAGFSKIHAFPFSMRQGTAAAKRKDLAGAVKKERMARMLVACRATEEKYLARFIGSVQKALFEDDGGYTENYVRVYCDRAFEGGMYEVRLLEPYRDGARCEIIKEL